MRKVKAKVNEGGKKKQGKVMMCLGKKNCKIFSCKE